ncbi:MAG: hypothetical protein ACI8RA_002996 [Chlamydiales bacterium]
MKSPKKPPALQTQKTVNRPLKDILKIKLVKPHMPSPRKTCRHLMATGGELQGKLRVSSDHAGNTIHRKATQHFHSAGKFTYINERDRSSVKIGKVLLGSTLSTPLLLEKAIYYIPAGTAYTISHPKNAWKNTHDKALLMLKQMKDPKFAGRIAGGLAGAGFAQIALGDAPLACTSFLVQVLSLWAA